MSLRTLFPLILLLALAGCGQKGDLYLPEPEPEQPAGEEADSEQEEEG